MAKRAKAVSKHEEIEATPLDQEIVIEVDDNPIVAVTKDDDEDEKKPVAEKKPEKVEPPSVDDDLKKRLADLEKAEQASRQLADQRQRDLEAAQERARQLEEESASRATSEMELQLDSVLNAIAAAESDSISAAQAYDVAYQNGDGKAMAEAQRKISRAEARLESLEQGKQSLEIKIETAKKAPPKQEQQRVAGDPLEEHIKALPELAKNWVRKNREYMENKEKNLDLQMAHLKAMKGGITPYTQSYIDFVEEELGMRTKPDPEDPDPEPARSKTVSAPVTRDPPSPVTGKSTQTNRVTLTAEEREFARQAMPGTPAGEAEKIYAQQKMRLAALKGQGHYQER